MEKKTKGISGIVVSLFFVCILFSANYTQGSEALYVDEADGMHVYFGTIHSHTAFSDGEGTPEEALTWARDVAGYDFYVITDHAEMITPSEWRTLGTKADSFNENGRFVAMRGFEWSHPLAGHICVFNTSAYTNCLLNPTLDLFYSWLDKNNGLAQFNHPGRERLVFRDFAFRESVADHFFAMETGNKDTGNFEGEYLAYYPEALSAGWFVAPTSNQDNHSLKTNSHRTAVIAPELTRDALISAMKSRRVYSTDDPNIKVVFKLDDQWMGSSVTTNSSTLTFTVKVSDDEPVETIELINQKGDVLAALRPGQPVNTIRWNPEIPSVKGSYYILITSKNLYDEPGVQPEQIAVTAPILVK